MSIFVFTLFLALIATIATTHAVVADRDSILMSRFSEWMAKHDIRADSDSVLARMFSNWVDNDKYIKHVNSQNLSYTLGHNAFSGMDSEEFSQFMGFKSNTDIIGNGKGLRGFSDSGIAVVDQEAVLDVSALPASVDWRAKGKVGPCRNQKSCGSCWAFSGTSTIETAVAIKTGKLYDLSEQQSVSCAGIRYGNLGCSGGMYNNLFNYDISGLCTEVDYPYTSGNGDTGTCIKTCTPVKETVVSSYITVTPYSDNAIMTALTVGSVNIALEADTSSFQLYKSGIYDDYIGCNSNSKGGATPDAKPVIDHAVVLVGYGTEAGKDYYILRNSWGLTWGLQDTPENYGYMKIARSSAYGKYGMCGLLTEPMYPIV